LLSLASSLFVTPDRKPTCCWDNNSNSGRRRRDAVERQLEQPSEIRNATAKSIVTNYTDQINLGLIAYCKWPRLHRNAPYDASYNPANYDALPGSRDSLTKRFRIPTTSAGDLFITTALPFYTTNDGYACYLRPGSITVAKVTPARDSYRCCSTKGRPTPCLRRWHQCRGAVWWNFYGTFPYRQRSGTGF
jgi:hypothetical protein